MERKSQTRFFLAAAAASLSLVFAIVTVIWPDWIELAFRVDPDAGSGTFEWAVVAALATVSLASGWLVQRRWRDWRSAHAVLDAG